MKMFVGVCLGAQAKHGKAKVHSILQINMERVFIVKWNCVLVFTECNGGNILKTTKTFKKL